MEKKTFELLEVIRGYHETEDNIKMTINKKQLKEYGYTPESLLECGVLELNDNGVSLL